MAGIFCLERRDERLELRKGAKIFEARILAEEGPASEAGVYAALKPFEGRFQAAEQRKNAGDLIGSVMSVTESFWIGAGAVQVAKRLLRIAGERVIDAVKTDNHWLIRKRAGGILEQ